MKNDKEFYYNLLQNALESIKNHPHSLVIGLLQTDTEQFENNKIIFEKAIQDLEHQGIRIFNQIPYLDIYLEHAPKNYPLKFEIFYKGLIQLGHIDALYVLPNYTQSKGAQSEIAYAQESGVPLVFLE